MDKPEMHKLYGPTDLSRYLSTVTAATIAPGTLPLGDGNGTVQRGGVIRLTFTPPHRGYGNRIHLEGDPAERFLEEVDRQLPRGMQMVEDGTIVSMIGVPANLYYQGRSLHGFELLSSVAADVRAYDATELDAAVRDLGRGAKRTLTRAIDEGVTAFKKGLDELLGEG